MARTNSTLGFENPISATAAMERATLARLSEKWQEIAAAQREMEELAPPDDAALIAATHALEDALATGAKAREITTAENALAQACEIHTSAVIEHERSRSRASMRVAGLQRQHAAIKAELDRLEAEKQRLVEQWIRSEVEIVSDAYATAARQLCESLADLGALDGLRRRYNLKMQEVVYHSSLGAPLPSVTGREFPRDVFPQDTARALTNRSDRLKAMLEA